MVRGAYGGRLGELGKEKGRGESKEREVRNDGSKG